MTARTRRLLWGLAALLAFAAYAAICFHSVQEIHYLKSFFPGRFTVEEAYHASAVELIKVVIIGIPFVTGIVVCVYLALAGEKRR